MKRIFTKLLFLLLVLVSCRSAHLAHQTEPLFLLPGRIRISHPDNGNTGVLGEQVQYTYAMEEEAARRLASGAAGGGGAGGEGAAAERLDTNRVYVLSGVTVVGRTRFAPLREGRVDINFAIHVPKEYLSDDYHISLTPELWHNDSLVALNEVVLRGKNFIRKQEEDYRRYDNYIAGIVDPSGYDTAFINRRAVDRELERRRREEINSYYSRWSLYQEYRKWRNGQQVKFDRYNVRATGKLNKELEALDMAYRTGLIRHLATRQDTAALSREYRAKRRKIIAAAPVQRRITLGTVPARYRDFYLNGVQAVDIEPLLPGEQDSIRIASNHIMHDLIAMNEIRDSRRQEAFNSMVPVPYRPEAHYSAVIAPEWNFNYLYTTSYPVTSGLRTLRLTLKGNIMAVDGSSYTIHRTDTLSYVVSSMDELADGSLIANPAFTEEQRREYTHAIGLLKNREYQRALQILNAYTDYNTALALTCLGYNQTAYDLLRQLPENADTHYLSAILCCRLKDEREAIRQFEKACQLDETKLFRADRDPEIGKLMKRLR